jgi:hypothetical protein
MCATLSLLCQSFIPCLIFVDTVRSLPDAPWFSIQSCPTLLAKNGRGGGKNYKFVTDIFNKCSLKVEIFDPDRPFKLSFVLAIMAAG